jgi:phosphoribosyl-dephospho-CoA transferase
MKEMEKYKEDENYYGDKVNKELNRRKKKYKGIHQDIHQIKKSSELISVIFNYVSPVFEKEKFKKLLDEYKKKIQNKHNKNYLTIDYSNTTSKIYVPSLYRIKYNQKY